MSKFVHRFSGQHADALLVGEDITELFQWVSGIWRGSVPFSLAVQQASPDEDYGWSARLEGTETVAFVRPGRWVITYGPGTRFGVMPVAQFHVCYREVEDREPSQPAQSSGKVHTRFVGGSMNCVVMELDPVFEYSAPVGNFHWANSKAVETYRCTSGSGIGDSTRVMTLHSVAVLRADQKP